MLNECGPKWHVLDVKIRRDKGTRDKKKEKKNQYTTKVKAERGGKGKDEDRAGVKPSGPQWVEGLDSRIEIDH